ncbi:MAG: hypothetical protein KAX38_04965, partial [Candidatus Krumholzibacteria bacterium]|nr:hypothetical protein [Candidatus Krumholzibacteria bacterium]
MLRGHIQISYYTYLLIGFLFVFESIHLVRKGDSVSVLKNLAFVAAAFIVAVGIAAVLVFPVREYASLSIRGGGGEGGLDYGYATSWSLHPREMLTFIFPWAFGFGKVTYFGSMPFTDFPNYLGVLTIFFSVVAIFLVRDRWKWFLLITAVLSTLISFGKYYPVLYDPLFKLLPYFNKFRVPVMILIVQQLVFVILMALGIEEYLRRLREGKLPPVLSPGIMKWFVVGGTVVFVLLLLGGEGIGKSFSDKLVSHFNLTRRQFSRELIELGATAYTFDLLRTVFLFVAIAFAIFISSLKRVMPGILILVLAVIGFFDLFTVSQPVLHPESAWGADGYRIIRETKDRDDYMKPDRTINFLKSDPGFFRIFPAPDRRLLGRWSHSTAPFSDNRFMISRIFSLGGYHAAKLKVYQDVMDRMFASFNRGVVPVNILNMLNTKYIVSTGSLFTEGSPYTVVRQDGEACIYKNDGFLPRVFFVDRFRVLPHGEILELLLSPDFDPSSEVLLEKHPAVELESSEGSHAEIVDYKLNSIDISAHVERPCILVLSEIAYPDWKVEVDGDEAEILTADYCLRAVSLQPGDHEIRFRFSSGILRISLIISIAAFVAAVAAAVCHRFFFEGRGKAIGSSGNNTDL